MSGQFDWTRALHLARTGPPFDALIMAAALGADRDNLARLRDAFPGLVTETEDRNRAPGGVLDTDGATR